MFEYVFHVIHLLVNLPKGHTQIGFQTEHVQRVFMEAPIGISRNPNHFMQKLFTPVAKAMDRVFNWRKLESLGSAQTERVLLLCCAVLCCAVLCCAVM